MTNRIGIVTLPGSYNYGNRLQAYASFMVYRKLGFESILLEITNKPVPIQEVKSFLKGLLGKKESHPEDCMSQDRISAFVRFNELMLIKRVERIDDNLNKQYCCFSVGSDQVWNPYYFAYNEDWFFLNFANPEQRIALAPSIGLDVLTAKQGRKIAKGLKNFSSLSIREKRGAELIKECSGRDSEVICDPTFVLSSEEWRSIADDRLTPKRPYIITYLLGGIGEEAAEVLNLVSNHGHIPIIPLSDREKDGEPPAGPAEFISLIDNATHVITDSFHAAVFSSILHTPLTIVHRRGGESMFSRLETLSRTLGIEEKVYGSPSFNLSDAGEYTEVTEAIGCEREKFMTYLTNCLDKQLPEWVR